MWHLFQNHSESLVLTLLKELADYIIQVYDQRQKLKASNAHQSEFMMLNCNNDLCLKLYVAILMMQPFEIWSEYRITFNHLMQGMQSLSSNYLLILKLFWFYIMYL